MCPKTRRVFRYLVLTFGLGVLIGWSSPSDAYVQQIVIDQTATVDFKPIILGTSTPNSATSYTIYTGRVFGVLKPNDPDNKIITDIDLAPEHKGRVKYIADFEIITPTDPGQRTGLMIQEVPNRGGNAINTSALIKGATYVQSGWQGDLLAQCSPSPAIPYPCFDLNSGPYGSLNTTTGVFTPPSGIWMWRVRRASKVWQVLSYRCRWQPISTAVLLLVRCTVTCALALMDAA